jgi:hypothetical protein
MQTSASMIIHITRLAFSVIMPFDVVYFYADCCYAEKTGFCSNGPPHSFIAAP